MPFDDDKEFTPKKKIGLKIDNQNSDVKSKNKPIDPDFQAKVKSQTENTNVNQQQAYQLSVDFLRLLDSKVLRQNKDIFEQNIEKELISKMAKLAAEINAGENAIEYAVEDTGPIGIGTLGLTTLLLRSLLIQRDRINKLEYLLNQSSKKISYLEADIKKNEPT